MIASRRASEMRALRIFERFAMATALMMVAPMSGNLSPVAIGCRRILPKPLLHQGAQALRGSCRPTGVSITSSYGCDVGNHSVTYHRRF